MNLAAQTESLLQAQQAASITNIFIYLLAGLFLLSLYLLWRGKGASFVSYAPNLLTSLGILGTFTGIVIGLIDFNITKIDDSIGPLLDGLKTAFITSLVGMALAIVFKIIESSDVFEKEEDQSAKEATPEDILASLTRQEENLGKMTDAIVGDGDSTLLTQIKNLRTDSQDQAKRREEQFHHFSDQLWEELQQFAEMLSKSATEQVIDALQQVIKDFNNNLTEQFGENFKQLNEAVKELVVWQEQYRHQLDDMAKKYQLGVEAISDTRDAVTSIEEQTKVIPATMEALRSILETNQHQIAELERHLEAFRDLRDRAVEAVPQIRENVDKMTADIAEAASSAVEDIAACINEAKVGIIEGAEQFENNVGRANEGLTSASDHLVNSSEEMGKQLKDGISDINENIRSLVESILKDAKETSESIRSGNEQLHTDLHTIQRDTSDQILRVHQQVESDITRLSEKNNEHLERAYQLMSGKLQDATQMTQEMINKEIRSLDESMQNEIERVISAMGGNLAGITKKFTDDYAVLVEQMNNVVRNQPRH